MFTRLPLSRSTSLLTSRLTSSSVSQRWLKILAADPVDPICAQVFKDHGHKLIEKKMKQEDLAAAVVGYDGLIVRSGVKVTEEVIRSGTKLRIIGRAGAGVDNIDSVAATRRGIIVMNTPGGNTSAAAELTLSLLMSTARAIPAAVSSLKGGAWDRKTFAGGVELKGKTIGIVGLGMIGMEVARRCQALDIQTIGFDPLVTEEKAAAGGVKKVSLEALYAASDIITLHTPLNTATRSLINKASIAKCKKGVIIINAARGGIVHEADLLEALKSGAVGGAALDVFEEEPPSSAAAKALVAHPRVVCTPHLGASTEEAQKKVAREIAQQMSEAFAGVGYFGVSNAPHLNYAHKPELAPFVKLAEALGSFQGQLWTGPIKGSSLKIDVNGPVFGGHAAIATLLKASVLKGLMPALPGAEVDAEAVNLINSALLADEANLRVAVKANASTPASSGPYAATVSITVVGPAGSRSVTGAVIEKEPRIVQVDHWQGFPTFAPTGHVLMFNNLDKPGAVGKVTTVLADNNINIASLAVARQYPGSPALSIIIADQRVPSDVSAKIEALDGISGVSVASFGNAYATAAEGEAATAEKA